MARNKGTFKFAATLEVQAASALDPRVVVGTKAELVNKETWPYEGETVYVYNGMQVAVVEEKAIYMLVDSSKILEADYSGWKRMDASAAAVVEVVDNLLSENPSAALSAKQGKVLNDKIADLASKITSIFRFKGSKATLAEIQATESPEIGDVYHNIENGGEYVYDGTTWELLGLSVDLSDYAKTTDVNASIGSAKAELEGKITAATSDLQGKIDTKVTAEEGKSLIETAKIDQIGQNTADIASANETIATKADQSALEAATRRIDAIETNVADIKVKDVDTTASNGVNLELSEAGVISVVANIKVKEVNVAPSNGVKLTLSETGELGVSVDPTTFKEGVAYDATDIKTKADIGNGAIAAGTSVESALTTLNNKITSAISGGLTNIVAGNGIEVSEVSDNSQTVSVKVAPNSNLAVDASGLSLVWIEE